MKLKLAVHNVPILLLPALHPVLLPEHLDARRRNWFAHDYVRILMSEEVHSPLKIHEFAQSRPRSFNHSRNTLTFTPCPTRS